MTYQHGFVVQMSSRTLFISPLSFVSIAVWGSFALIWWLLLEAFRWQDRALLEFVNVSTAFNFELLIIFINPAIQHNIISIINPFLRRNSVWAFRRYIFWIYVTLLGIFFISVIEILLWLIFFLISVYFLRIIFLLFEQILRCMLSVWYISCLISLRRGVSPIIRLIFIRIFILFVWLSGMALHITVGLRICLIFFTQNNKHKNKMY